MSENNRLTVIVKTPNPLFEKWLSEWMDEAEKSDNIPKRELFRKALKSLKKFPILLSSGKECMILEHFDTQLCISIDRRLAKHRNDILGGNDPSSESSNKENHSSEIKMRKVKEYVPTYKSAAYALLVTLHNQEQATDYKGFMTKSELQVAAQCLTDTSLKKPASGSFYTGWSSMSLLVTKGLIVKSAKPAMFSLSPAGRELAIKLSNASQTIEPVAGPSTQDVPVLDQADVNDIIAPVVKRGRKRQTPPEDSEAAEDVSNNVAIEDTVFLPNSFDIILLVDTAETAGGMRQDDRTLSDLKKLGVKCEVRRLKVGDFFWIARDHMSREMVLPYIIERKTSADFVKSIKDGRFHEQKFRLKQCGLPNLIYLLEKCQINGSFPLTSVLQAATNTMVTDGFVVKITENHAESLQYLATLTTLLTNIFKGKVLFSCNKENLGTLDLNEDIVSLLSFQNFSKGIGKNKNFSAKEMFVKELMQLHSVSADKAWVIASKYQTPAALIKAARSSGPELLSDLEYGLLNRKIGTKISQRLHSLYSMSLFPS